MPTFQDFLADLERDNELARVKTPVSPLLEIAAITDKISKTPAPHPHRELDQSPAAHQGGRALLFESVQGSDIPVAINTFGSYHRICKALNTPSLNDLAQKVQQLVKPEIPTTLLDKMKRLPDLMKMASYPPKLVRTGLCQQVIREGADADLTKLPIIQCWPLDGQPESGQVYPHHERFLAALAHQTPVSERSEDPDPSARHRSSFPVHRSPTSADRGTPRYITLAGIYTQNPDTGDRNIGMYRVQLFGPRKAAMHWHLHHDGARHFRLYQQRNQKMPVAIVLGGEPLLTYAATAPLPPGIEELLFAGFLNNGGIELVKCRTNDLEVPANAEIVIEGFVDPHETLLEGPFGDHTGFYSLADTFPALTVTAITHRKNPVYPTTIVGKPPMEDYYLGKATERIFLPLLRTIVPDILDYNLPLAGVFHNCAFVKIKKQYPYQARRVMHAIWGAGQMSFTKFIVVVDEHVDVHNQDDVLFHLFANTDPKRDSELVQGPTDILDHASPDLATGSKIGFDATVKLPGEGPTRRYPQELDFDPPTKDLIARRWREYGL